ncbi:MAG: hypothetical protein ACF8R9_04015 [Phycisphaerales bacterium JB054]
MTGANAAHKPDNPLANHWRGPGLLALALAASLLVVSLLGSSLSPLIALGSLVLKLGSLWPGLVYLAAAYGLAWPLRRLWRDSPDAAPIQLAVGVALMFSLSHLLGVLGLLSSVTAIGSCVIGIGLAIAQIAQGCRAGDRPASLGPGQMVITALAMPAAAVLIVAALMPPGWLWGSEYGGFDALSYHLQLPQEWLAAGRLASLEHNVYSYLPGYIEAAFMHLGALTLVPLDRGLLAGDGWRLLACQGLHAGLVVVTAWLTARATTRLALRAEITGPIARWSGAVAGCLALATPWAVVTGSLAYNEAGVNAMLAGVLLVCAQERMSPVSRGALVGLLVGVACGFKPTAMFFVGVPAGLLLIVATPRARKTLLPALVAGAVVGLITLAPWLIRNALHGGNPVFPFASDLLGTAHWTGEQITRYQGAHSFDGSAADRLRTLLWSSPTAGPGSPAVERFRGLANPQWGVLPLLTLGSIVVLLLSRTRLHITGFLLAACLAAQLVAWLAFTHLQSRFLLPLLPIGATAAGLAVARLRTLAGDRPDGRGGVALLAGFVVVTQSVFVIGIYASQQGGSAGIGLPVYPTTFTDRAVEEPYLSAAGWCNTRPLDDGLVLLVGDSTPLYFGPGVVYHTTYDTSPLGELMRATPADAIARGLREQGIGWVLVNDSELRRLQQSGWYDPDVTPDSVRNLADELGGAAMVWPDERRYLLQLAPEGTP